MCNIFSIGTCAKCECCGTPPTLRCAISQTIASVGCDTPPMVRGWLGSNNASVGCGEIHPTKSLSRHSLEHSIGGVRSGRGAKTRTRSNRFNGDIARGEAATNLQILCTTHMRVACTKSKGDDGPDAKGKCDTTGWVFFLPLRVFVQPCVFFVLALCASWRLTCPGDSWRTICLPNHFKVSHDDICYNS